MIHLLVYISTAAAAVLSIIQAGKQILPWIAGIVVYVLAAVLLTLSCVFFYHDLRENVIKKILEVIKKNPLGERFLADYTFRTILTTLPAFLINVAYTVYNGVIGIMIADPDHDPQYRRCGCTGIHAYPAGGDVCLISR